MAPSDSDYLDRLTSKYSKLVRFAGALEQPFLNWGYWCDDAGAADGRSRAVASESLVRRVARLADQRGAASLLDVGCGTGGSTVALARHLDVPSLIGVDLCGASIDFANDYLKATALQDRVRFLAANAVELPFEDASFDTVTAIECAFHFHPRTRFFEAANRLLRPGGQLIMTDWIQGRASRTLIGRIISGWALKYWDIPKANIVNLDGYETSLRHAGFCTVSVTPIADKIIPHYARYVATPKGFDELSIAMGRMKTRLYIGLVKLVHAAYRMGLVDYVIVEARKD